jgi:uracil-DNA glycosylase
MDITPSDRPRKEYGQIHRRLADRHRTDRKEKPAGVGAERSDEDPYHGEGEANGLCFSVNKGIKVPPSLRNIYKELAADINHFKIPNHGNIENWAKQGVLLLNTSLTVIKDQANSQSKIGWHQFTNKIIETISNQKEQVVFILWGKEAQKKAFKLDLNKHCVISSPHPSPLSCYRGFFGSKPFSKANEFLNSHGLASIDWNIS